MKLDGMIYKKTFALPRNQYESISLIASLDKDDQSQIDELFDDLRRRTHELQQRPRVVKG